MPLRFFNTLGRKKEIFQPIRAGQVKIYSCGPTVYNFAHIGNLRAFLFADTLVRWLRHGEQMQVQWCMNITDVDDKTISLSQKKFPDPSAKKSLKRLTRHFEEIFFQDLETLGIERDSFCANPRATEFIPQMQDLIRRIFVSGFAKVKDDSVFFDVDKFSKSEKYGVLLPLDLQNLRTGTRTLADETTKDNLQDFALWKAAKPGEPAWDFQLENFQLPGRPGWHIECSAMANSIFSLPFDIHTGGVDLIFPHHENEVAQARAGLSCPTANFWLHNEHLLVDGKKMSKSLGNFFTLPDLLEKGHSAESIRFFLVTNHHRAKLNLTDQSIFAAQNSLEKIRNSLANHDFQHPDSPWFAAKRDQFFAAMRDDLNTPVAIAVLHYILKQPDFSPAVRDFFTLAERVFGVRLFPREFQVPPEIFALAREREIFKQQQDWENADRLRDQISKLGWEIRDGKGDFEIFPLQK